MAGEGEGGVVPAETQAKIDARIKELTDARRVAEERAEKAERAAAAERTHIDALRRTIDERLPKPKEPEPEWVDPGEQALKESRELRAELARRDAAEKERNEQIARVRAANNAIQAAATKFAFEDPAEAVEILAREYGAHQHYGMTFDAEAVAAAMFEKEQARVVKHSEAAKAETKRKQAEATASPMTSAGGVSVGVPRSDEIPKLGTPERDAWRNREAESFGFKGGGLR